MTTKRSGILPIPWLFYMERKGKKKKMKRDIGEAIHIPGIGLLECGLSGIES